MGRLNQFSFDPDSMEGGSYPELCDRHPLDLQRSLRQQQIASNTPEQVAEYNAWVKGWLLRQQHALVDLDAMIEQDNRRQSVSAVLTDDLVDGFLEGLAI